MHFSEVDILANCAQQRYGRNTFAYLIFISVCLVAGCLLNIAAYGSIFPVVVSLCIFPLSGLLNLVLVGRRMSLLYSYGSLVSIYWLIYGFLCAVLDPLPLASASIDSWHFFESATSSNLSDSISVTQLYSEGALAIHVWHYFYNFFGSIGVPAEPYVAIALNIALVAATGSATLAIAHHLECSSKGLRITFTLFATSGLFLMFAILHIRDAFVLYICVLLSLGWIKYLRTKSIVRLLIMLAITPLVSTLLLLIRAESSMFALAMPGLVWLALALSREKSAGKRGKARLVILLGAPILIFGLVSYGGTVLTTLEAASESYLLVSLSESLGSSMGLALVVNQPTPVRLVLGPAYILLMPIPIWSGIFSGSVYTTLKSLQAIQSYFLFSGAIAATWILIRNPLERRAMVVLLVAAFWAMIFAISLSSLETRHMGPFIALLLPVLGSLQKNPQFIVLWKKLAIGLLSALAMLHFAYALIR